MAVLLITLQALKDRQRAWIANARAVSPPAPHSATIPQPPDDVPVAFANPDEPGLGLSPREIEPLVDQSGQAGGKALLSLILRMSSLEAQIADLRARVASSPSTAVTPPPPLTGPAPMAGPAHMTVQPPPPPRQSSSEDGGKDGILEQIFNNNLALWQSLEDDDERTTE